MARGNIAEFTSPVDRIQPSEVGAEALAQAGRHIGYEYNEIGRDYNQAAQKIGAPIEQHETMTEISQGAHTLAAATNNLQTQWNEFVSKSDPNDKSIQGKFLDNTLEPFLDQFQGGFSTEKGQEWAMQESNRLRDHFTTTTAADMSTRAGDAVLLNTVGQANQLGNTVYRDPSSLNVALQQLNSYYDAAKENNSGVLRPEQLNHLDAARLDAQNEIVKNAVKGLADSQNPNGPAAARKLLDSGAYDRFLPAQEQEVLQRYIDRQEDSRKIEAQQKSEAQKAQQVAINQKEVQDIFSQISSGKGYLATVAFANQNLSLQEKNDFVAKRDGILTLPQEFLTSPMYGEGFSQVAQSVYNGQPITASALTMGVRRREITPAGAVRLLAISNKMKTPEGMAEVHAQGQVLQQMRDQIIKGGPNGVDPAGTKLYNQMLLAFYPAWDAAISSGKSIADIADPNSKEYIGNIANGFKRTPAQALADVTAPKTPPAPLPPPAQRVIDHPYTNPNGVTMWWTGKGWSRSAPQAAPEVPKPE